MELEALEVEDLARLAAAMVARRRCERTVSFSLDIKDELPAVLGERLAVLRVLDNLISNALKHNTQVVNLRIWLKVRAKGPHVLFEVGDDGTGIAAEALPCLFEFGFSADSTGKVKGHGLGLWSSRRLVEAMGGEIWATSEPGRRTHFYFTLPVANDSLEAFEAAIQDGFQSVHQLRSGELAANGY